MFRGYAEANQLPSRGGGCFAVARWVAPIRRRPLAGHVRSWPAVQLGLLKKIASARSQSELETIVRNGGCGLLQE